MSPKRRDFIKNALSIGGGGLLLGQQVQAKVQEPVEDFLHIGGGNDESFLNTFKYYRHMGVMGMRRSDKPTLTFGIFHTPTMQSHPVEMVFFCAHQEQPSEKQTVFQVHMVIPEIEQGHEFFPRLFDAATKDRILDVCNVARKRKNQRELKMKDARVVMNLHNLRILECAIHSMMMEQPNIFADRAIHEKHFLYHGKMAILTFSADPVNVSAKEWGEINATSREAMSMPPFGPRRSYTC